MLDQETMEAIVWARFEKLKSEPAKSKRITPKECPRGIVYDDPLRCSGVNIEGIRVLDPHEADASAFGHDGRKCRRGLSRCRQGQCTACVRVRDSIRSAIRRAVNDLRPDSEIFAQLKRCPRCRATKPGFDFGRDDSSADALNSECRSCHSAKVARTTLPETKRAKNQRRRARKAGAEYDGHTPADLLAYWAEWNIFACIYCNGAYGEIEHIEHVMPLSRGGSHTVDNLAPSCEACNLSKGWADPWAWIPRRLSFIENDRPD